MEDNYNPFDGRGGRSANSNEDVSIEDLLGMEKLPKSPPKSKAYTATVEDTATGVGPVYKVGGNRPSRRSENIPSPSNSFTGDRPTPSRQRPSPSNSFTGDRPQPPGQRPSPSNSFTGDRPQPPGQRPSPSNSFTGDRQQPGYSNQPFPGQQGVPQNQQPYPNQQQQVATPPKQKRPSIVDKIRDKMTTKDWIALILLLVFLLMLISPHSFKS